MFDFDGNLNLKFYLFFGISYINKGKKEGKRMLHFFVTLLHEFVEFVDFVAYICNKCCILMGTSFHNYATLRKHKYASFSQICNMSRILCNIWCTIVCTMLQLFVIGCAYRFDATLHYHVTF